MRDELAAKIVAAWPTIFAGETLRLTGDDLQSPGGYWRQKRADVYAWESWGVVQRLTYKVQVNVCSWETMTALSPKKVKLVITKDGPVYEVGAA